MVSKLNFGTINVAMISLKRKAFPELFHLKCNMKAFVVDHMRFPNETIHLALNLIRTVQD